MIVTCHDCGRTVEVRQGHYVVHWRRTTDPDAIREPCRTSRTPYRGPAPITGGDP